MATRRMPWPLSPLFLFPDPSMFRWFLSTTIHSIGIGISISWHYLALPPSPRELLFRQAPQLKPPALPRLTALHTVHYHNTKRRISISCLSLPGSVPPHVQRDNTVASVTSHIFSLGLSRYTLHTPPRCSAIVNPTIFSSSLLLPTAVSCSVAPHAEYASPCPTLLHHACNACAMPFSTW